MPTRASSAPRATRFITVDTRIDIAYRDYETRDLIALEKEIGKPLDGMRILLKQNRMISSLTGDFDHKSCFEILTDPELAGKFFSPDDCRLFERHVLWTRDRRRAVDKLAEPYDGRLA